MCSWIAHRNVLLTFSKENFEDLCHDLFTSEWGVVFWRRTSKRCNSISCRCWRKVKRMPKAKSATGVNYSSLNDSRADTSHCQFGGIQWCHLSLKSWSKLQLCLFYPWPAPLSSINQARDCQHERRGYFPFYQNEITLLAVPKNL